MSVYDPTVGSGGMLIQAHQYIEEQGQNADDMELFGQENNPSVVAICKMNIILHNIKSYTIEYGDTITDPLNLGGGEIRQFDRVIANPPFSQNYNRNNVEYLSRFQYGFAPEGGKKGDLMFVQHMLASCKRTGKVVVIMPHGVLFRGGQEKEIRENMLKDGVLEGIISLPPHLFYGTGIPACIMVFNKSKPDKLKNKVFIINADKEYAEGKNQNTLRPEDIEKIDFVFTQKLEEARYSKLVDLSAIAENDFTLNVRRYVDNTPPPEPEDVKAHLKGGIPVAEIETVKETLAPKFKFDIEQFFQDKEAGYKDFIIEEKAAIKQMIEKDKGVTRTLIELGVHLINWWQDAKDEFSSLAPDENEEEEGSETSHWEEAGIYLSMNSRKYPKVRKNLLHSIKESFVPVGILDQFQVAGVFVNWWDNIKYDLKTIMQSGWDADLIPDEYLIEEFFQTEKDAIEQIEGQQSETEAQLEELVEEALEMVEFESDEEGGDIKHTPSLAKRVLKEQIHYYTKEKKDTAAAQPYLDKETEIKDLEKVIKEKKRELKMLEQELDLKIELKRLGSKRMKTATETLLKQSQKESDALDTQIEALIQDFKASLKATSNYDQIRKSVKTLEKELKKSNDQPELLQQVLETNKEFKKITKAYNACKKDQKILQNKLEGIADLLRAIGGKIQPEESKKLLLQKHFDLINEQLQRYLNAEKRALIQAVENLFDKYHTSAQNLEDKREETMQELTHFLTQLNYLD